VNIIFIIQRTFSLLYFQECGTCSYKKEEEEKKKSYLCCKPNSKTMYFLVLTLLHFPLKKFFIMLKDLFFCSDLICRHIGNTL